MKKERFTITAALPYTNGPVHIGHLAGVYVPADIYARYLRRKNKDIVFICGSDEHGVPITLKAKKEGVSPQDVVDKYHAIIQKSFQDFGISFDNYSRTSAKIHHETASDFFEKLYKNNQLIEETNEQLYDEEAQQFLADRFVTGTCPKCGNPESYGDQCEKCGTSHHATDLINPRSAISGSSPTKRMPKHWYLPLNDYESFLRSWIIGTHSDDWKTNVLGQVKSWLNDGLKPRAVTRDLDWGIPVPVPGAENKVLYVWFDAPIGYISSTKEWAAREGKDWESYWKDKETKLIHFIGKDNIVFHCIIFPAMLKAEGSYILPENVPANEFLNLEGNKISTSRNWAVWLHEYLQDFPEKQDVLRYVLTANAPETKDNDFTWKDFQAKNNNELVAILGNFINRVVVLTHKYYQGKVPAPNNFEEVDKKVMEELRSFPEIIGNSMERYRFREASQLFMNLARLGNKYLADEEPWKKIKTTPQRVETILYVAMQITAGLAFLAEPLLPFTSKKILEMLKINNLQDWDEVAVRKHLIEPGHEIGEAKLLFEKIEDEAIEQQLQKLEASKQQNIQEKKINQPMKASITFEDFEKLDIRIGTIIEAEKVPKTSKLLKLKIQLASETRTVVSGIAGSYEPAKIIGQQVTLLANLEPRKIKGIESQGMILMTDASDEKLSFLAPTEDTVSNGSKVS
jgi:methionyl-tRNA synthetase